MERDLWEWLARLATLLFAIDTGARGDRIESRALSKGGDCGDEKGLLLAWREEVRPTRTSAGAEPREFREALFKSQEQSQTADFPFVTEDGSVQPIESAPATEIRSAEEETRTGSKAPGAKAGVRLKLFPKTYCRKLISSDCTNEKHCHSANALASFHYGTSCREAGFIIQ